MGPSPIPFEPQAIVPDELSVAQISEVVVQFEQAAKRALKAGFKVVEIHMAHGYLCNEFLSPLSNKRGDGYGGSMENQFAFSFRSRKAVQGVWPKEWPIFARISATDWTEGGWNVDHSVELAKCLKNLGVDLIDCSAGGNVYNAKIAVGPGYRVPFAEKIRSEAAVATGAVGLITEAEQAEEIVSKGRADVV